MHENTRDQLVRKKSIDIIPQMYKYIQPYGHFTDAHLKRAMNSIFAFLAPPLKKEANKDRGQGFVALGKMSLLVPKHKFDTYLKSVFQAIE
jgi:hypothetical protein